MQKFRVSFYQSEHYKILLDIGLTKFSKLLPTHGMTFLTMQVDFSVTRWLDYFPPYLAINNYKPLYDSINFAKVGSKFCKYCLHFQKLPKSFQISPSLVTLIDLNNFSGAKLPAGSVRRDPLHHSKHLQGVQRVRGRLAEGRPDQVRPSSD